MKNQNLFGLTYSVEYSSSNQRFEINMQPDYVSIRYHFWKFTNKNNKHFS